MGKPNSLTELKWYLVGFNESVQDICKFLLAMSEDLKGLHNHKDRELLRTLAYTCDRKFVVREDTVDGYLAPLVRGMSLKEMEVLKEAFRKVTREATRGLKRILPPSKWREFLGFESDELPTEEEIGLHYKERAKTTHPDLGGTTEEFVELQEARAEALEEVVGKHRTKPKISSPMAEPKKEVCPMCNGLGTIDGT